jgi:hypothetical protein
MEINLSVDSLKDLYDAVKKLEVTNGKKDKKFIEVNGTKFCFRLNCQNDTWWINEIEEVYNM